MRLIIGMSKRECGLTQQAFKHVRLPNGRKRRFRLAPDSKQFPPEIFSLPEIVAYEQQAEAASNLELQVHKDNRGADVAGKEFAIDQVIVNEHSVAFYAAGTGVPGSPGQKLRGAATEAPEPTFYYPRARRGSAGR